MIKITYFVHGTTTDNEQDLATGWLPGKLSELGIKQAEELGKLVADKKLNEFIDKPFPNGESYKDVEKRIAGFFDFLKKNYKDKHVAIVAHQGPQLALDVLLKRRTWKQAIKEDWRNKKAWQPGWEYLLN